MAGHGLGQDVAAAAYRGRCRQLHQSAPMENAASRS